MGGVGGINGTGKLQCERRGRRLGAPYPLPLRGRWLLPQAKDGGRETEKSLPQSNAAHLTAPSSEGAETAGAKFSEFGHPFVCFADISPIRGITPPYRIKLSLQTPIGAKRHGGLLFSVPKQRTVFLQKKDFFPFACACFFFYNSCGEK